MGLYCSVISSYIEVSFAGFNVQAGCIHSNIVSLGCLSLHFVALFVLRVFYSLAYSCIRDNDVRFNHVTFTAIQKILRMSGMR